jgi:ribosome-associated protein
MRAMKKNSKKLLNTIAQIIYDKKGFNIITLDIRSLSSVNEYMIVAEGNVDRHVKALAATVIEELKKDENIMPYKVEGKSGGDWVVIDYHDVVVHLFMPTLREKYQLERLWPDAKIVDLKIKLDEDNNQNDER